MDRPALGEAQASNDAAQAQAILQNAFRTDVRPLIAEARHREGGAIDPLGAYREIDYRRAMIDLRGAESVSTGL